MSFLGNVMLMSYFVSKRERGAIIIQVARSPFRPQSNTDLQFCTPLPCPSQCSRPPPPPSSPLLSPQALGVASNFAMLTQIFLAGFLPAFAFNGLLAVTVGCFAINVAKVGPEPSGTPHTSPSPQAPLPLSGVSTQSILKLSPPHPLFLLGCR